MAKPSSFKTIVLFPLLIALVVILSIISGRFWGGKPEALPETSEWIISEEMTVNDFGRANKLSNPALKAIFKLQVKSDLQKKLSEYGTANQIKSLAIKKLALAAEHDTKNWIHFFCPFGLVGWLVEKVSRIRISVDYETCIGCQKCAKACPSTVMGAILRLDKKTIPDCFACYACREVCPTESISFSTRKRALPPPGHFEKKKQSKTDKPI